MTRSLDARKLLRFRREDGVAGIIVALSLVMTLGMLGLAVDGGSFLMKRRQMVNTSDAAALSYAISCVLGKGDVQAGVDANATAISNVPGATRTFKQDGCTAGKVKVTYSGSQARYFLPILGLPATGTVSATASAAWGGAGGSITPPIEISMAGIQNCHFTGYPTGPPQTPEQQCVLMFPPQGSGDWGGLNTTNIPGTPAVCKYSSQSNQLGWNVCGPPNGSQDARPNCGGMSAQEARDAMDGNVSVTLNPSGTTWACSDNGQTNSIWNLFNDGSHVGKIFCFPVTDQTKLFTDQQGRPKAYDVVGFIPLRVKLYNKQGNNLFLTVSWPGPQPCGTVGGGPPGFGAYQVGLSG
jgi:Flp pilus assembly protein TadG